MPKPREQIHVCEGCGATATEKGGPLPAKCRCGSEGATWTPIVPAPLDVSIFDPVAEQNNEYARRVRNRLRADTAYLLAQQQVGHAEAATAVCERYGHDARAGLCLRCGGRLARSIEEELE